MPVIENKDESFAAIDLQKRLKKIQLEEKEKNEVIPSFSMMSQELAQKRTEQELEKIVRKKIEIERLFEQKNQLTKAYKNTALELEVIKEEKDARDSANVRILEQALKRANVFLEIIEENIGYSKSDVSRSSI